MIGLLFFFSALGAFNGIVLSLYLFFFDKQKSLSKLLLGALILALSIRIGKSVLLYFDRDLPKIYLQIGLSACLFIGPFLYFYLKTVLQKITAFPQKWKWLLLGLLVGIVVVGSIRPYPYYPAFWNTYVVKGIYAIWFVSVIAAGFILKPIFLKCLQDFTSITSKEKWLLSVYVGNLLIASVFFAAFFGASMAYYISGPLVFSFFLYLMGFAYFTTDTSGTTNIVPIQKYANKKIDPTKARQTLSQLTQLMVTKKIYTNPQLKLKNVAQELDIPTHQLSQLLNDNLGKSYASFINEYRIQAACELLATPHNLSLEGIGYEVGFKSKSTFFTTFKKITGLTPAQFQQQKAAKSA